MSPSSGIVNNGVRGFGLSLDEPDRKIGGSFGGDEVLMVEKDSERLRIAPPRPATHKFVPPR